MERKKESSHKRGRGNKETCVKKVMKLVKKYNQPSKEKKTFTKKIFVSRQHVLHHYNK